MSNDLKAVYSENGEKVTRALAVMMGTQSAIWAGPCEHCGGTIGPDTTNRAICYGCGPVEMIPAGVLTDAERARRRVSEEWP